MVVHVDPLGRLTFSAPEPEPDPCSTIGGRNNYLYYYGRFLVIILVEWAPKSYSNF